MSAATPGDIELMNDATLRRFLMLSFLQKLSPSWASSMEHAIMVALTTPRRLRTQAPLKLRECWQNWRATCENDMHQLKAGGYCTGGNMVQITESGVNYLSTLTVPDMEYYRSLMHDMAVKLTPTPDDPSQVALGHACTKLY